MKFNQTPRIVSLLLLTAALTGCQSEKETSTHLPMEPKTETSRKAKMQNLSLTDQLSERAAESAANAPADRKKQFKAGIEMVRDSGILDTALQLGDTAVDGHLIGWDGETFQLSKLWAEGPIILMWYRGGWCPYCNIQLQAMQERLSEIEAAGARLVVLTPEMPGKAKETAEANDIDMVALHDKDNRLAAKYGIMFDLPQPIVPIYRDKLKLPEYNGTDKLQLPLAATYVIDQSGQITYAFLDADYKKRAEPDDVIDAVKTLVAND